MSKSKTNGGGPRYSKIDVAKYKYDLDNLDEKMREWYEEEGNSYRDIERKINKKILQSAMEKAGGKNVFEGHAETLLSLIRGDEANVTEEAHDDAERHLKENGVNIERVKKDFVSHQTVGNYLKDRLEINPKQQSPPDIEKVFGTINALKKRLKVVTERSLNRLNDEDLINVGSIEVSISVNNWCKECGKQMTVGELLSAKKCDCYDAPVNDNTETGQTA